MSEYKPDVDVKGVKKGRVLLGVGGDGGRGRGDGGGGEGVGDGEVGFYITP